MMSNEDKASPIACPEASGLSLVYLKRGKMTKVRSPVKFFGVSLNVSWSLVMSVLKVFLKISMTAWLSIDFKFSNLLQFIDDIQRTKLLLLMS